MAREASSVRIKPSPFTTRRLASVSPRLASPQALAARPSARTPAPVPYRVIREKLSNGLRLVTVELPHVHTASVALYVRAGSRYETPETNGLSHFVEHMLFRGSAALPSSYALNSAIEELGGTLYAETGRDYSLYQVSLAPRGLEGAASILGELFRAPLFREIDLEREMILEELLEDLDDRGRNVNVDDLARAAAFPNQPLGYSIIGPARNVRRFSVEDVRAHFDALYGARNMVLCVGGRVRHADVAAIAQAHFAALRSGRRAVPTPAVVEEAGPRIRCLRTDTAQTQLQMVFHGLPDSDPDYPALVALLRLLDDGMATPLHYRVCDQRGLAYSIGAEIEPLHDTSLVELDAACAPGKLVELLGEVFAILREQRERPPEPTALARIKRRYRDQLEASYDDVDGLCGWFGGTELFFRPRTHEERARMMDRVTGDDVQRVADRVLRRARMIAVVAGAVDDRLAARAKRALRAGLS